MLKRAAPLEAEENHASISGGTILPVQVRTSGVAKRIQAGGE